ncbi:MAG: SDR family NAD(P)-dependent oxidoreductase [Candidatus Promineifilaceae bacterium]|nr:SDR family NAD(P)-dependent oxidoreductase [Candidatus Promineifilaceae bacterium]
MSRRVAVVTGGSSTLGRAVCRALARRELRVLLAARSVSDGEAAAAAMRAEGGDVHFYPLDVGEQMSVRRFVKSVADRYGRADILVNGAAIYLDRDLSLREIDPGLVRQTLETNFFGALRLSQMLVPLMQRHSYGRIVNLSSEMGLLSRMGPQTGQGFGGGALAYRVSQAALHVLTRVQAAEEAENNILVNSVDPQWQESGRPARTVESHEGLRAVMWLATLPAGGPTGGFFVGRRRITW